MNSFENTECLTIDNFNNSGINEILENKYNENYHSLFEIIFRAEKKESNFQKKKILTILSSISSMKLQYNPENISDPFIPIFLLYSYFSINGIW